VARHAALALVALVAAGALAGGARSRSAQAPAKYLIVVATAPDYAAQPEIVDATGRIERMVGTAQHSQSWQAAWSPDRSQLAWVDDDGVSVERADGSAARRAVRRTARCRDVCAAMSFAWSPDGTRLLVGGAGAQTTRLVVAHLATGVISDVVRPRAYVEYRVVGWSGRGRSIAYIRYAGNPGTRSCCRTELYVARADARRARRVFAAAESIHDPPYAGFSPGGRSLAFVTEARDPRDPPLAVVDVTTRVVRRIRTVRQVETAAPAWSPDSTRIAVAGGSSVATVSSRGRDARVLHVAASMVAWSPSHELTIVCGERAVCASEDGAAPPKLLFRLPPGQAILSIDPV
jgi:Tol biopolymer transport system component